MLSSDRRSLIVIISFMNMIDVSKRVIIQNLIIRKQQDLMLFVCKDVENRILNEAEGKGLRINGNVVKIFIVKKYGTLFFENVSKISHII